MRPLDLVRRRRGPRRPSSFPRRAATLVVGGGLVGWSLFNLVEGVIDHHILQLHHVREFVTWHAPWDWAFLVASAVIGAVGLLLLRGRRSAALDDSR